jgi:ubiquitin carboxyl-terminal hydrolase 8
MASSISYAYQHLDEIDYNKYKNKGYTGLVNLGNTCFMNSCLQCLSHTYQLRELLTNDNFINTKLKNINDGTLIKEWYALNNLMWSENCVVSCDRWLECVQKTALKQGQHLFTGFYQNDCAEFLIFILNDFHDSIKRSVTMTISGTPINNKDKIAVKCFNKIKELYEKEYSELINIFFGVQIMRIKSATNNTVIYVEKPEPFFVINAPIPETNTKNTFTINDCFDIMLEKELLEGDNAWYNEKTKEKENVYIEHSFWNLPNVLILCLKRFNNFGKKINKSLMIVPEPETNAANTEDNYSIMVNLSKYVENHDATSYKYEVYGFCIHSGGTLGGHYISVVKTADNKWCVFNDQHIEKINNPSIKLPKLYERSYCLFLKKI